MGGCALSYDMVDATSDGINQGFWFALVSFRIEKESLCRFVYYKNFILIFLQTH